MSLKNFFEKNKIEAGCDEAGRGCLAGPVFASAVILPEKFHHKLLNDSKQMTEGNRNLLREIIEKKAVAWAVGICDHTEIDSINILNASFLAMHRALEQLPVEPQAILVDGNRFKPYKNILHHCIIEGDAKYKSIAAASVLAKTHRDEFMMQLHQRFPQYGWNTNKAYATKFHREALMKFGETPYHRKSFRLYYQLEFEFAE
ncbi:MAG TPA: ribonuclease HII [Bacteroidia bacterium]|nr:ribonuclease HII [Bacteroidia bacterium]